MSQHQNNRDTCPEGCGADVVYARTVPGKKRMPLDPGSPEPGDPMANIAVWSDHLRSLYCRVVSKAEPLRTGERLAVTHFATCPERKKQAAAKKAANSTARNSTPKPAARTIRTTRTGYQYADGREAHEVPGAVSSGAWIQTCPHCPVQAQGGEVGLRRHIRIVHPEHASSTQD